MAEGPQQSSVTATTLPAPADPDESRSGAVDGPADEDGPVDGPRAQWASVRMTLVRMIDSLIENWRSSSFTSTGLACIVMTA